MQRVSLKTNALWALGGNVIYAGTQWAILVVLTKLLDPAAVGKYALGLAISAPVFGFASLQLRAIQAADVRGEWAVGTYVGLRLATSALALLFIYVVVLAQNVATDTACVIMLLASAKGVESLADIFYGILQKHEDLRRVSLSLIQRGVIGLVFMIVIVASTQSVVAGATTLALAWAMVLVYYDLRNVLAVTGSSITRCGAIAALRPQHLLGLARVALPMGGVIGMNSLTQNIPRYFVADSLGNAAVGYYSAISYLLASVAVVVSAIGQAVTPRLASYYVKDITAYVRLIRKSLGVALLVGCVGLISAGLFGKEILTLLYTPDYGEYAAVFVWTMLTAVIFACVSVLGVALTAARRFHAQAVVSFGMMVIAAAACAFLVPNYGLDGAAISSVIALVFKFAVQSLQLWSLVRARSQVVV